ncbi:hypothetical protein ACO2I3_07945 [Leptospira interrogans]
MGALILRDVLETVFLVDYFRMKRSAITKWRMADQCDGFTNKKRPKIYELFSELAGQIPTARRRSVAAHTLEGALIF